jgi:hypothetical protein
LRADPHEAVNLVQSNSIQDLPEAGIDLNLLFNWLQLQRNTARRLPVTKWNKKIELEEGLNEQLKALGYIQ